MMKHRELFLLLFTLGSIAMGDEAPDKNVGLYSPVGKRDPFQVPKMNPRDLASNGEDLFKYPLESFQLRAILKSTQGSQILLEDPKGKNHVLQEGDTVGRGRATISRVLEREVIFTERVTNYLGVQNLTEKTLALPADDEFSN
ncbi:hypothetical protein EBR03_01680 [bacterium]|nr:hypothetical protein [bacterium]